MKRLTVVPHHCRCHPETCSCDPYDILLDGVVVGRCFSKKMAQPLLDVFPTQRQCESGGKAVSYDLDELLQKRGPIE